MPSDQNATSDWNDTGATLEQDTLPGSLAPTVDNLRSNDDGEPNGSERKIWRPEWDADSTAPGEQHRPEHPDAENGDWIVEVPVEQGRDGERLREAWHASLQSEQLETRVAWRWIPNPAGNSNTSMGGNSDNCPPMDQEATRSMHAMLRDFFARYSSRMCSVGTS